MVYEDLKKDLMGEMQSLEEFVGIPLTPEQRLEVVKHCSFDSMKVSFLSSPHGSFSLRVTFQNNKTYYKKSICFRTTR